MSGSGSGFIWINSTSEHVAEGKRGDRASKAKNASRRVSQAENQKLNWIRKAGELSISLFNYDSDTYTLKDRRLSSFSGVPSEYMGMPSELIQINPEPEPDMVSVKLIELAIGVLR